MTSARRPARASNERRSARTSRLRTPQAQLRSSKSCDPIADAVRYLTRGDRSADQVERYLTLRKYPAETVRGALRTLRRLGYINDEAVALRLAQNRLARRPMGREALAAELKAREFSAETIARAVRGAYAGTTEQAVAEGFLMSLPPRHADPVRESRRRAGLLRGRGFPAEVIEDVIVSDVDEPDPNR